MLEFLAHLVITAALLLVVANVVNGITITGWGSAFLGALILGLVNALIRPIMVVLTLPLTIVTFGLFLLVVNALMFWLMAAFVPGIKVERFGSAFFGALLLAVLNLIVGWVAGVRM
jgi:putative membrane protein